MLLAMQVKSIKHTSVHHFVIAIKKRPSTTKSATDIISIVAIKPACTQLEKNKII